MLTREYITGVLKDFNCSMSLVISAVGLLLRLVPFVFGPPSFSTLETITGVVQSVQRVTPPQSETRLEIIIKSAYSTETLYVRRFDWLTNRAPSVNTLKSGDTIHASFRRDDLGRGFLECWQILRGEETIFSYDDMVWADHESDLLSDQLANIFIIWGVVVFIVMSFLKKKEMDVTVDHPEGEYVECDWLNHTLGGIVYFSLSLGLATAWYRLHTVGQDIWWLLGLSLIGLYQSLHILFETALLVPRIIYLKDNDVTIYFVLRESITCYYTDIETIDSRKKFWRESHIIRIRPAIRVVLGQKGTTDFEILLNRVRERNPQCVIL